MSTPESKGSDQDEAIRQWTLKCVALSEQNERMAGILRELGEKSDYCPICDRWLDDGPGRGHALSCRLYLLLKDLP